jgi:hypothetical protein
LLDELALQERPRGVTVDHDDGRPASFVDVVQIALRDPATV